MSHSPPIEFPNNSTGLIGGTYPVESILGGKRAIPGKSAHIFKNGKLPKMAEDSTVQPLSLASPPPKSRPTRGRKLSRHPGQFNFRLQPPASSSQDVGGPVPPSSQHIFQLQLPNNTPSDRTPAQSPGRQVFNTSFPPPSQSSEQTPSSQHTFQLQLPNNTPSDRTPAQSPGRQVFNTSFPPPPQSSEQTPLGSTSLEASYQDATPRAHRALIAQVPLPAMSHPPVQPRASPAVSEAPQSTLQHQPPMQQGSAPSTMGTASTAAYLHEDLIITIQREYLAQYQRVVSSDEAVQRWATFSESDRAYMLQRYDHYIAEAHWYRMQQASLAQRELSQPQAGGARGQFPAPQGAFTFAGQTAFPLRQEPTTMSSQPVTESTMQVDLGHGQMPSNSTLSRDWSLSTVSSLDGLGLLRMEDVVQSATPHEEQPVAGPSREAVPEDVENERSLIAVDKGKRRAVSPSGSDASTIMNEDDVSSSASSHPSAIRQDPGDQSGFISSDFGMLMMQQMQGFRNAFETQAMMMKQMHENNMRFQEMLSRELQDLKGNTESRATGNESPSASHSSPPSSFMKSTRTVASDRKVEIRVAKALGVEPEITPEAVDDAGRNTLREYLHAHVLALLNIPNTSKLAERFPPLTEDEVTSYEEQDGTLVCTPEEYRIDFQHDWKGFSFNAEARAIAISTFLKKAESGAFAAKPILGHLLNAKDVGKALDRYMVHLRRTYRAQLNPPSEEKKREVQRAAAKTSRQGTLYRSRRFVVVRVPRLGRHRILFTRLSACNMSGDETDGTAVKSPAKYRMVLADWQSKPLRTFFWGVDQKYIAYWENPPKGKRRTQGNGIRVRILSPDCRTVPGTAPPGLWRNCYNPEWLAKQSDWQVELLGIIDEDYDFSLD